jgi:hypothetical protein
LDADADGHDSDDFPGVHPGDDCDDTDAAHQSRRVRRSSSRSVDENCNGSLLF